MADSETAPTFTIAPERIAALTVAYAGAISAETLPEAIRRYDRLMTDVMAEGLGERTPACGAACGVCCHQPIFVSVLELARIYFSDEPRFTSAAFREQMEAACATLMELRGGADRVAPLVMARRQFAARKPCLMLGDDENCTIHAVKPATCRNAWSMLRCTYTHSPVFGFPDVAGLGRSLRLAILQRYDLRRFEPPGVDISRAIFYLPEGLTWLMRYMPLDAMRPIFVAGGDEPLTLHR